MDVNKIHFYPKNKYLRFVLKNIVYPIVIVSTIFYLISYLMLLKTDKIAVVDNTSVYVNDDMTENRDSIIKYVKCGIERVRKKGIETDLNAKIVFCRTAIEYNARCISLSVNAFARTRCFMHRVILSPIKKHISVNDRYKPENQIDTIFAPRYYDEIISHELTHIYQYEKLSMIAFCHCSLFEKWKIEGYADYIGGASSMRIALGEKMFLEGKYSNESLEIYESFFVNYFVGRLRTDYLLNFKKIQEDEYWRTSYDVDKLDEEIRVVLRSGEYKIFRQNDYE